VIGGVDQQGRALDVVERYDPVANTWETDFPALKKARTNAAAAVYHGWLYVLGGRTDEGEVTDDVEVYNPSEQKWESSEDLKEKREGLVVVVLKDEFYVVGGGGEDAQVLKSVEYLDHEGEWSNSRDWELDLARVSFASVVVGDTAFSIGGFGPFWGPLAQVEYYHPGDGNQVRASLPEPRGGLGAVVVGDKVFVIGGRRGDNIVTGSVDLFIASEDRWQTELPLLTPRENMAAVAVGGVIYVIGGRDDRGQVLRSVEAYRPTGTSLEFAEVPVDFALSANRPNPFSEGTHIAFEVTARAGYAPVRLLVFDVMGKQVATLVNEVLSPGPYEVFWDGSGPGGRPVSAGAYLYRLEQGPYQQVHKMIRIR